MKAHVAATLFVVAVAFSPLVAEADFFAEGAENVSANPSNSIINSVTVNASGHVFVVWSDDATGDFDIYYRVNDGTGWTETRPIAQNAGRSLSPIARAAGDAVHVVWMDNTTGEVRPDGKRAFEAYYAFTENGLDWSEPEALGPGERTLFPSLATDPQGRVHVFASDAHDAWYRMKSQTGWSERQVLSQASGEGVAGHVWVAAGPGGERAVAYRFIPIEDDQEGRARIDVRRLVAGQWLAPETLSNASRPSEEPSLAIDPSGRVHAAFAQRIAVSQTQTSQDVLYRVFANGAWGTASNVTSGIAELCSEPRVALNQASEPRIAYHCDGVADGFTYIYLGERQSGIWVSERLAAGEEFRIARAPWLAIDATDTAHVTWYHAVPGGQRDIFYLTRGPAPIVDEDLPRILEVLPPDWANAATVNVTVRYSDNTGVDATSATISVNGVDRSQGLVVSEREAILRLDDVQEGSYAVAFSIADPFGNRANRSWVFQVDLAPPTATVTLEPASPDGEDGWYRTPVRVTSTGTDSGSGYAGTGFALARDDVRARAGNALIGAGIVIPVEAAKRGFPTEGNFTLIYWGLDVANNRGPEQTVPVRQDSVAPTSRLLDTAPFTNREEITLSFEASDVGSGVRSVEVFVRSAPATAPVFGDWESLGEHPAPGNVTVPLQDGWIHHFRANARDVAGNVESKSLEELAVTADRSPPTVTITQPADGAQLSSQTNVLARAEDQTSGVAIVRFLVDGEEVGESALPPYAYAIVPDELDSGTHTVTVRAEDGAGNVGEASVEIAIGAPTRNGGGDRPTPAPAAALGALAALGVAWAARYRSRDR